jgi:hypothetical protein
MERHGQIEVSTNRQTDAKTDFRDARVDNREARIANCIWLSQWNYCETGHFTCSAITV